jgi:hypothetical protein
MDTDIETPVMDEIARTVSEPTNSISIHSLFPSWFHFFKDIIPWKTECVEAHQEKNQTKGLSRATSRNYLNCL